MYLYAVVVNLRAIFSPWVSGVLPALVVFVIPKLSKLSSDLSGLSAGSRLRLVGYRVFREGSQRVDVADDSEESYAS